jgi:peptide/nickel transport system substrate-binding protein
VFKKLRYLYRLVAAVLGKYYLAVGLGLGLGIVVFSLSPYLVKFLPRLRQTESIAMVGRFSQSDLPLNIQQKISIGLTTIAPNGQASPALATQWTTQDNGKTYIFNIDTSRIWQDGTHIKSSDIKFNFKDTVVEYPDNGTLVMRLKDAFSPLPVVVSRPVFKTGLLGAGSFKVDQTKKNGSILESITLVPTDKTSRLPKIRYLFYPSEQQARIAFKLGLVKAIEDVQETSDLAKWPKVSLSSMVRYDRYIAVFFNTTDPYLTGQSGKNLRLALTYAIDKSRWENRALGPVNPNSWAYNKDVKKYDYDFKHSRDLLSKIEKLPTEIKLSTLPSYLPVAEAVKSDWEKLGLNVSISVLPEITSDFTALIIAQAIPTDPDQYNLWHSTQGTNLTHFSNARIDKLLEDGRKNFDLSQRQKIYLDFQKFLVEEVPAVFLYHPMSYTLIHI